MEVYEIIKSIGSGSFGQVYLVKHKLEDKLYVVKKIKTRDMQPKDREATEQEVRLLQKLRHTNIVAYKDSYLDQDQFLNIVMVHCEGGDMYNKIRNCKGKNFPESQVLDWFAQMALALYYLHDKKILHRDLKTQNIFLKHGRVRLGDFGIAKVLDSTRDFANTCIGTPYYMSPELFKYKPYSYKSDVWALGCVMYEICNLRHAFDAQSFQGLAVKIIKGSYPPITPTYSKQLRDLIGKMLSLNPKDRPTIVDIMNKPILKRRIVNYMAEIFSGNYPEANMPNDVDDIYVDSLRDQAENLGLMYYIQESIAKGNNPEKLIGEPAEENEVKEVNKKEVKDEKGLKNIRDEVKEGRKALKQAVEEKQNLEKEIEKLEKQEKLHKKMLPKEKGSKSRNFSQERIKKIAVAKIEESKDELSNRDVRKVRDDNKPINRKAHSKDTKYTVIKTEASIDAKDEKFPKLVSKDAKKNQVTKETHYEDEEEKVRSKQRVNIRKYSAENMGSMDDIAETDDTTIDQSKKSYHDAKQKVLFEKEKKRKEEEQRRIEQLKNIRQDNVEIRRLANEKVKAQYRPSQAMVSMLKLGENGEKKQQATTSYNSNGASNTLTSGFGTINDRETLISVDSKEQFKSGDALRGEERGRNGNPTSGGKNLKIEEDYGMNDEIEDEDEVNGVIEEHEEEYTHPDENLGNIKAKIEMYRGKLEEKTMNINKLKESLKKTLIMERTIVNQTSKQNIRGDSPPPNEEDEENYSDSFDIEEGLDDDDSTEDNTNAPESEVQEKKSYHPQYYKIQDRIKLLRYRCEAGIGNSLYEKAYRFLNERASANNQEENRKYLIDILGEENIGFWHLIDQILLFEGFAKKFQEVN